MASDDTEVFIGGDGAGSGTHKAAMQKAAERERTIRRSPAARALSVPIRSRRSPAW